MNTNNDILRCENCGKRVNGKDGIPVSNEMWCAGCVKHHASICECCMEYFKSEDVSSCMGSHVELDSYSENSKLCAEGDWYCKNCLDEEGYCSTCCEIIPQEIKASMKGE